MPNYGSLDTDTHLTMRQLGSQRCSASSLLSKLQLSIQSICVCHTNTHTRMYTIQFLSWRSSKSTGFFIWVRLALHLSLRHCLVTIMAPKKLRLKQHDNAAQERVSCRGNRRNTQRYTSRCIFIPVRKNLAHISKLSLLLTFFVILSWKIGMFKKFAYSPSGASASRRSWR